jgi:hypothetical protein
VLRNIRIERNIGIIKATNRAPKTTGVVLTTAGSVIISEARREKQLM